VTSPHLVLADTALLLTIQRNRRALVPAAASELFG
jgi:hypothetical protein